MRLQTVAQGCRGLCERPAGARRTLDRSAGAHRSL